jgi:hypothetical protein
MDSISGKTLFLGNFQHCKSSLMISMIEGTPTLNSSDDRTQVAGLHVWNVSKDKMINIIDFGGHYVYQQLAHLFIVNSELNLT